jgi:hypothetical protein
VPRQRGEALPVSLPQGKINAPVPIDDILMRLYLLD